MLDKNLAQKYDQNGQKWPNIKNGLNGKDV